MEVTILKVVLAAIFTLSVVGKLTGKSKSTFENAGYSPIIMYATALAEILLTIGLFTQYEWISAVGLLAIIQVEGMEKYHSIMSPLIDELSIDESQSGSMGIQSPAMIQQYNS